MINLEDNIKKFLNRKLEIEQILSTSSLDPKEFATLSKKFKKDDKLKCMFVVVLGENEIKNGLLQLKNLKTGDQQQLTFEDAIKIIKKKHD